MPYNNDILLKMLHLNITPGTSPVWQQSLNEISRYFRDLQARDRRKWRFTTQSEARSLQPARRLQENVNKVDPLQSEHGNKKQIHSMDLTLSVHVMGECSQDTCYWKSSL